MTSTHIEGVVDSGSMLPTTTVDSLVNGQAPAAIDENDAVDDSSFSDPYDEQEKAKEEDRSHKDQEQSAEVDDDYAMTFDSDVEEDSNRQDVSIANVDQEMQSRSEPLPPSEKPPTNVPVSPLTAASAAALDDSSHIAYTPPTTTAGDAPIATDSTATTTSIETLQSQSQSHTYDGVVTGEIDIQQLLDNITATAEYNASNSANATPTSVKVSSPTFPPGTSGLPAHASLPPRPQIIQKPPMHPAYASQDDIRKYHAGPPSFQPSQLSSYRQAVAPVSIVAAGAPGTSTDPRNVLPPPPSASFHPPSSISTPPSISHPMYSQPQRVSPQDRPTTSIEHADTGDDGEVQWDPSIQKLYDEFLAEERMYVTEGQWDRFPAGSRLFIGNLPTEKVTKRDLFYVFHKYGRLAQVSIKQAYGFVQFHDIASCYNALEHEQGQEVRKRKMHLEISKPQKNTRGIGAGAAPPPIISRRSRSPDYSRVGRGTQAPARGGAYDRYDTRPVVSSRDSEFRAPIRARDDYRPGRSPSPARGSYRGRDDYPASRGRDYYDGRERRRSRSRSPYDRRENGRYRERSLSPRVREADEDADLKIPRRDARDVPEVQIILMDELDRGFVAWAEGELRARGIKTEVMFLSPRLSLAAIIRRQILEGVLAVSQFTRRSQDTSKIPLQIFDRKGGADNVRFDEYQDLEPRIAAELVSRAKQSHAVAPSLPYGQPQFAAGQSYQPLPSTAPGPNLANLVGQLDNATLQKLLGTLNTAAPVQHAPSASSPVDLAGILGGIMQQQQQQQPQQQGYQSQPQPPNQYHSSNNTSNLASLLGGSVQSQAPGPQSAQQVQNIMAQLARFRQ